MIPFQYIRAREQKGAISSVARNQGAKFIAGGTNLVDLMKKYVMTPEVLVDITRLPLKGVTRQNNKLTIGALTLNSTVAEDKNVLKLQPLLSMALKAGATAQIRNMATVGGNIMQRTRCPYFYNTDLPCNKRQPGSGCGALEGYNRMHAIFGFSEKCIAVHPSDMAVALAALDATVVVEGVKGKRNIAFNDFHRLPGDTPEIDNNLRYDELITAIEVPDNTFAGKVHYVKVRDRQSYAFALVSVAAALTIEQNTIKHARLAMGGVAHKPWRLYDAEKALIGQPVNMQTFTEAAAIGTNGAKAFEHNLFKLKMAPAAIIEALQKAADA